MNLSDTNYLKTMNAPSHKNSFLLSFEGIEGSGKSTQIDYLKEYLEDKGYNVLVLREPGGTKFGEGLRSQILTSTVPIDPIAEAYLFASSRAQLLREKVLPFLEQKKSIVILDRYFDSSIAYQGFARGLGALKILKIHEFAPLNIIPHITFYLKINLETSLARQKVRGLEKDYFEKESKDFYSKLIEGYDYCADSFPSRVKTIDASQNIDEVKTLIIKEVEKLNV